MTLHPQEEILARVLGCDVCQTTQGDIYLTGRMPGPEVSAFRLIQSATFGGQGVRCFGRPAHRMHPGEIGIHIAALQRSYCLPHAEKLAWCAACGQHVVPVGEICCCQEEAHEKKRPLIERDGHGNFHPAWTRSGRMNSW